MAYSTPILGTVISGFLGSGKTTFINRILKTPHGKRIAVIVNEFGEIGIDGALLAQANPAETFVELDNGCLCCSLNRNLEDTLATLKDRGNIDHVIIETTGIADPLTIFWTFTRPRLGNAYHCNMIATIADMRHLAAMLTEPTARLQIEQAHLLIMSKTDLVTPSQLEDSRERLQELNSHAVRVDSNDAGLLPLLLDAPSFSTPLYSQDQFRRLTHSEFETCALPAPDCPVEETAVRDFLEDLPATVLRAKGIVRVKRSNRLLAFHKVIDDVHLDFLDTDGDPSGAVCIGHALDLPALRAAWGKI